MKHLEELSRSRPFKLFNLMPEEIAKNEPPSFFIPTHNVNCKFDTAPILDKHGYLMKDRAKTVFKKAGNATTIVNRFLNSKKSCTRLTSSIFTKTPTTSLESRKSRELFLSNPIKFVPYSINRSALFDKGCVTCGKDNIDVKYYGERHICLRCRNFLKTANNDTVHVYLNENGDAEAVGERIIENGAKSYYCVETNKLWFKDYRCYATLAQENELIVLLHDDQSLKKIAEKAEAKSMKKK